MALRIAILLLLLLKSKLIMACGCGGPINSLQTDIDSSDAIFIGIVTEISEAHKFHLADQIGNGLNYINFDIHRSKKGLNKAQLKITVFDFMSNSSCEGLTYGKQVGDTILVFADEYNSNMLGSYLCGRHPKFENLSIDETNFIDTATWNDPRTKYHDVDEYIGKQFPDVKHLSQQNNFVKEGNDFWLYLSLMLNLILVIYLIVKTNNMNR